MFTIESLTASQFTHTAADKEVKSSIIDKRPRLTMRQIRGHVNLSVIGRSRDKPVYKVLAHKEPVQYLSCLQSEQSRALALARDSACPQQPPVGPASLSYSLAFASMVFKTGWWLAGSVTNKDCE